MAKALGLLDGFSSEQVAAGLPEPDRPSERPPAPRQLTVVEPAPPLQSLGGPERTPPVASLEPAPARSEARGQVVAMGDGGVPPGTVTKAPPSVPMIPPAELQTEEQPDLSLPTAPFVPAPSRSPTPSVRKEVVEPPPMPGHVSTPSSKLTSAQLRPAEILTPVTAVPTRAPEPAAAGATAAPAEQARPQGNEDPRLPAPAEPPIGLDTSPAPAPEIPAVAPAARSEAVTAATATETVPAAERAMPLPGSPFGLGLGLLRVVFDGTPAKVTDVPTISVSGRIQGGAATALVLRVNDSAQDLSMDRRSFHASVTLAPGPNRITAVVMGPDGLEAEDSITIEYAPKAAPGGIALSSPVDGLVLGPDDPPAVLVDGRVENPVVSTVWLVANERAVAVSVRDGRFRRVVPVLEPLLRLRAESRPEDGASHRSDTVTVSAPGLGPVGLLLLDWLGGAPGAPVEVGATRRDTPGRLDSRAVPVPVRSVPGASASGAQEAVYVRNLKPGAYTFTVRLDPAASMTGVRPTLYFSGNGTVSERALQAIPVDGKGRLVVARILLPQGILWDDDGWTGKSESVDTITKFRLPEGITWIERKADLR